MGVVSLNGWSIFKSISSANWRGCRPFTDESQIDKERLSLELALTAKLRQQFPHLPDEIMMRLVPYLEMVKNEDFGSRLPWNRRQRRRLMRANNAILHLFSGPDEKFWHKKCAGASTEVLCIDTTLSTAANLHDRHVHGFLLMPVSRRSRSWSLAQ